MQECESYCICKGTTLKAFLSWYQNCRSTLHRHRTSHPNKSPCRWCWTTCLLQRGWEKGQCACFAPLLGIVRPLDSVRFYIILLLIQILLWIQVSHNLQCFYWLLLFLIPSEGEGSSLPRDGHSRWFVLCVFIKLSALLSTQFLSKSAGGIQLHLKFWPTTNDRAIHHLTERSKWYIFGSANQRHPC